MRPLVTQRHFAGLLFAAAYASLAMAPSCGGEAIPGDAGSAADAAATDGAGDARDAADGASCAPYSDASEPEAPSLLAFDGSIPAEALPFAVAMARCSYWATCSPLAPFVVDDCVRGMQMQPPRWSYPTGSWVFSSPSAALLEAVDAGAVAYDRVRAWSCLRSLQTQLCHGPTPWLDSPTCAGVFTCADDAGACAEANALFTSDVPSCVSNQDCADAGGFPAGPFCFSGHCVSAPCGSYDATYCTSESEGSAPCDSDPPFLGSHTQPGTRPCSAGLTCRGFTGFDGGLGVCAPAEDVGGPCVHGAAISGCATGLVCPPCGACAFPPKSGACSSDQPASPSSPEQIFSQCQYGVAYCDNSPGTPGTCRPVAQQGGDCSAGPAVCASDLVCDQSTSTCGSP